MTDSEEPRVRILRLCYLGCRYHPVRTLDPKVNTRPCPAKRVQGQLRRLGYEASQSRGRVQTNAPASVLDPLYEAVEKRRSGSQTANGPGRKRVRRGKLA